MRHQHTEEKAIAQLLEAIDSLHQLQELTYLIEIAERSDEIHLPHAEQRVSLLLRLFLENGFPLLKTAIAKLDAYHDHIYQARRSVTK